ncbi:MAG: guanylate kinase [Holophaga sp.]|nr:guanylate kinase [Holophaga sp.]
MLPWLAVTACAVLAAPDPPRPPVPGSVFVLSAPSGTGKSTLVRRLVREVPGLVFAVSHTTRAPRPGEQDGVDYFFVDDARFDAMLAEGQFQEWVELFGHRYGLSRDWMDRQRAAGKDLLLDLDTHGARKLRKAVPDSVTVLLLPPSAQELARRLRGRGTESAPQLALRLGRARHELSCYPEYDYLVVNEDVNQAFRELEAVVLAARARQARRGPVAQGILAGF